MSKLAPITYHPNSLFIASREDERISYIDAVRAKFGFEIYPIDPYVEVFPVSENTWALHQTSPAMPLSNWMYLIKGPEKALLIDNGYGLGNLKGLCEELTHQQVICAISHYHPDHGNGSFQWNKVYCHDYCADLMEKFYGGLTDEEWIHEKNFCSGAIGKPWFRVQDVVHYNPNTKFIHLENHSIINLGEDYDIELIHMGGHAPGLSAFLDKKGRALYTADAVLEALSDGLGIGIDMCVAKEGEEPLPHSDALDPRFYQKNLRALAERIDEYDVVRDGHASIDSDPRVVTDLRDAIDAALENPNNYTGYVKGLFSGYLMQRGIANCRYTDPKNLIFD